MIDIKKLDQKLIELINKKMELSTIGYDNEKYDDMEEELHDLEDDFIEEFGDYLEDALHSVHDEYCPDNDVLLPIAYLANTYKVDENKNYSAPGEGVFVDADDFDSPNTRLVILPNPTRIVLNVGKKEEILWTAH